MSECIHDWDFSEDFGLYKCLKCGRTMDSTDAMNHLNMLESDLANERALYAEKQTELNSRNALIERLVWVGDGMAFKLRGQTVQVDKWDKLTTEYQAMKGGEG